MNSRSDIATQKFLEGFNCAQAVLYAFSDEVGLDRQTALKIACGFGAGMGRRQEVCGAVSGGIMAVGLRFGRGEGDDRSVTEVMYAKTHELMQRFEARHGTCLCRALLDGCDLKTEEGLKVFRDRDLLNEVCKRCVASAVEIVEDLLHV